MDFSPNCVTPETSEETQITTDSKVSHGQVQDDTYVKLEPDREAEVNVIF